MAKSFNPAELIDIIRDGKTCLYMVDGIMLSTYGQAYQKALAVLKSEAINRAQRNQEVN